MCGWLVISTGVSSAGPGSGECVGFRFVPYQTGAEDSKVPTLAECEPSFLVIFFLLIVIIAIELNFRVMCGILMARSYTSKEPLQVMLMELHWMKL